MSRRSLALLAALPVLLGLALAGSAALPGAAQAAGAAPRTGSGVTGVQTVSQTPLVLAGGDWVRTTGVVTGVVDPRERVAGLAGLPLDAAGRHTWTSQFELVAPAHPAGTQTALVEAENRGAPLVLGALEGFIPGTVTPTGAAYPAGLGNGFLFSQGLSYARVQWQAGIADGVPESAQGVGEVVVRDFGRLLQGRGAGRVTGAAALPRYRDLLLAGVSQSAWFVNTLLARASTPTRAPGAACSAARWPSTARGTGWPSTSSPGTLRRRRTCCPTACPSRRSSC